MKRNLLLTLVFITTFSCITLNAQEGQVFNVSVDYPDQGTIGSAGNTIDAYGTVIVPVGGYARFYLTGNAGYEPAGFYIDGQYQDDGLFELKVEEVTSPILVVGTFRPVQVTVGPTMKIITPYKSSIVKTGAENTVNIDCVWSVGEGENIPPFEIYKNGTLLPNQPVKQEWCYFRFRNLPLDEGDNLFMVRVHNDTSYDNYTADFVLIHYSATGNVDNIRAAIIVDSRLFSQPGIGDKLTQYAASAGWIIDDNFSISIEEVNGVDDWSMDQVKDYISGLKNEHKALEGVLLVGNIKLPSFFRTSGGVDQSRLCTQKYEDLDLILQNRQSSQADYDYMAKGADPFPELWCAVMPVGIDDVPEHNTYEAFASQLNPYLDKLVMRYGSWSYSQNIYLLSDKLPDLNCLWQEWGLWNILFNSVNDTGFGPYNWYTDKTPDMFYKPMEIWRWDFFYSMNEYYRRFPWIGDGWQSKDIYKTHMKYDFAIAWTDADSSESESVITAAEAKNLSGGGCIQMASGNSVAGFRQYGSTSYVDTSVYPDGNILCGYLYGTSFTLTSLGSPFNRVNESLFEKLAAFVAQADYVGKAYYFRKCLQYYNAGSSPESLAANTQELLIGDPFAKIGTEFETELTPPTQPQNVVCTNTEATMIAIRWDACTDDDGLSGYNCNAADSTGYEILAFVSQDNTSCTIEALDPNTTYTITVQAVDNRGYPGDWSTPISATTLNAVQVQAPVGFTCTGNTDMSIDLSWEPVSGETGILMYEVSYKYQDGYESRFRTADCTALASIGGLIPETTYSLRVRAIDMNYIPGFWSDSISVTTNPTLPPTVPQNLRVTAIIENSVSIAWDPSTDNTGISCYYICAQDWTDDNTYSCSSSETFTTLLLAPNITYNIIVQACDLSGNASEWSDPITVTTKAGIPPTVPQNLVTTQITEGSVSLLWEPSTDVSGIAYYIVHTSGTDGNAYNYTTSANFVTVHSLNPGVSYTFSVQSYDNDGYASEWSTPVTATTFAVTPPTVPTHLVAIDVGVDSITIDWDPSTDNAGISYYYIAYKRNGGYPAYDSTTDTRFTFTGLTPGMEYTFTIRACDTDNNFSDWSDPLTLSTLTPPPGWTPVPAGLGDVNGDSSIDIVDSLLLAQYYVGLNPTVFILSSADVNDDGIVDIVDALLICQYYVGLIYPWPPTGSTPGPTSVPYNGVGNVWIDPAIQTVDRGTSVTIEIHANTGSAALGAFGFTVAYPANLFTLGSVTEIASGLNLMNNTTTAGTIITAGFNANGVAGNTDLALVRIVLTASSSEIGMGSIGLSVTNLNDSTGYEIGTPSATGGTVTVVAPDETPPTVPQNLVAIDVGVDYIMIGWDPSSDDAGISYYYILCSGSDGSNRSFISTEHQIRIQSLMPGTTYTITVIAVDTSGNRSNSEPISVTTLPPPPDWTPVPVATPVATGPVPTALTTTTPVPTVFPTGLPTATPSGVPTTLPTSVPLSTPTATSTAEPTFPPTAEPTSVPTSLPARTPNPHKTPRPTPEPLPDLVAQDIRVVGDFKPGSLITFSSGITNSGKKESGQFKTMWTVNSISVIASNAYENLRPGVTITDATCEATWTPKRPGMYVVAYFIDPCNKVKETTEWNNVAYKKILIKK